MSRLSQKIYVYVAGPLNSSGRQAQNVRKAVDMAEELLRVGFVPFVPHLYAAQWAFLCPDKEGSDWLKLDFAWLERCDVMVRLTGKSLGTEEEEAFARARNIPIVFEDLEGSQHHIVTRLAEMFPNRGLLR